MEAFYALATLDYVRLAEDVAWEDAFGALLARRAGDAELTLLDVACGSGKFPAALLRHARLDTLAGRTIDYALLDPSAFSLAEAAGVLRAPFAPGARHETTLQGLDPAAGPFDVVWATHALYALPPAELAAGAERFLAALAPDGLGFVAHAAAESFYLHFYARFLADFRADTPTTPYLTSDEVVAALRAAGGQPRVRRIAYDHTVAAADEATLEGYLQRCAFDDGVPLAGMLAGPTLGPYLAGCRQGDRYRFPQEVDLVFLGPAPPEGDDPTWNPAAS